MLIFERIHRARNALRCLLPALLLAPGGVAADDGMMHFGPPIRVQVVEFEQPPLVDGLLDEWLPAHAIKAVSPRMQPSTLTELTLREQHGGWAPDVQLMAGIHGDRIYFALSWSDLREDVIYRPWKWDRGRFRPDRKRDDMVAFRFHLDASDATCMLSDHDYVTDVWRWTAGRSALAGIADDMSHQFSTTPLGSAAVYEVDGKSYYIRKRMDRGDGGWHRTARPHATAHEIYPGVELASSPSGSRADVAATAGWREGRWHLELSRMLETGDPGDVVFTRGGSHTGQLALFDAGYRVQKAISGLLHFEIPDHPAARSGATEEVTR